MASLPALRQLRYRYGGNRGRPGGRRVRNARRLGGSTSFYKPPLTTPASLKKIMANKRVVADLRTVLEQGGVSDIADKIRRPSPAPLRWSRGRRVPSPRPRTARRGVRLQAGDTLQWMAFKPRVKGKPTPSLLQNLRWSGKKPFKCVPFPRHHRRQNLHVRRAEALRQPVAGLGGRRAETACAGHGGPRVRRRRLVDRDGAGDRRSREGGPRARLGERLAGR